MDTLRPPIARPTALDVGSSLTRPALREPAPPRPAALGSGEFDGLIWSYRGAFKSILERRPAAFWSDGNRSGWEEVKRNASRVVFRAVLDGQLYYLKYFFSDGWAQRIKRALGRRPCESEWNNSLYAQEAGIPAARVAGLTSSVRFGGRSCSLLVTEAVTPAYPLNEFWQTIQTGADARRRRADVMRLTELLAEFLAHAHQAGFAHLDLHPANILIQPTAPGAYRAVFVDLQSVRTGAPLSDAAVTRNLASLNQWFRKHAGLGDRLRFLRSYLRERNEYETCFPQGRPLETDFADLVRALMVDAERHAERLGARRDRRLHKNGRYFARIRTADGWRGAVALTCKHALGWAPSSRRELARDWWTQVLREPLALLRGEAGGVRKDSHSAQVATARLPLGDGAIEVIAKRSIPRNAARRLRHAFGPSRARRGWKIGHQLLHRDVAAARPLAFAEQRRGLWLEDSILLTERVAEAVDLETFARGLNRLPLTERWARTDRLALFVRRFLARGFVHRDCKAPNILVAEGRPAQFVWIDMDGIRRARPWSRRDGVAELLRLHVSLLGVKSVTRTDRARFLKRFCARFGARADAWRKIWRQIDAAAGAKIAKKEARRAWKRKHYGRE